MRLSVTAEKLPALVVHSVRIVFGGSRKTSLFISNAGIVCQLHFGVPTWMKNT